jgi:Amt family ammonium transporter
MALASKVAVNTTLAAAAGGLTSLACEALLGHPGDIGPILNGILSGEAMHVSQVLAAKSGHQSGT